MDAGVSLGFKLPLDWRRRRREGRLPDLRGSVYEFLCETGFRFVEFPVGLELDANAATRELLERELCRLRDAGLGVALHPGPGKLDNDTASWFGPVPDCQPGVEPVLEVARLAAGAVEGPVPVVLHPAQFLYQPEGTDLAALRREMVRRSRLFFCELGRRAAAGTEQLRTVAEHQVPPGPSETLIRVGDTCDELLEATRGCSVGLCWDTGHYLLAVQRYGQEEPPPEEFLDRVEHVHLHDVVEGRDHRVVTRTSDALRDLIVVLRRSGFRGGVTLEYSANAVREAGGPEAVLSESAELLGDWLEA